jgi:dextranase
MEGQRLLRTGNHTNLPRLYLTALCLIAGAVGPVAGATLTITALRTDRARYLPGQSVTLTAILTNSTRKTETAGSLRWTAFFLDHVTATGTAASKIRIAPGVSRIISFRWQPPRTDYQGYVVAARLCNLSDQVLDTRTTAVDVSSNWAKFLRYGFVSNFAAQSAAESQAEVATLQNYHLNALFFYDWQYQHQTPLAGTVAHPAASWKNIANKTVSRQTVLDLIDAAHQRGMAAMNYNLLYGAWQGYSNDGIDPSWGLWKKSNETDQDRLPMPAGWATPFLYLF